MTDLKQILIVIENHKSKIATERDALRNVMADLEDTLESLDSGIEGLETGILEIERAIDSLSETV